MRAEGSRRNAGRLQDRHRRQVCNHRLGTALAETCARPEVGGAPHRNGAERAERKHIALAMKEAGLILDARGERLRHPTQQTDHQSK